MGDLCPILFLPLIALAACGQPADNPQANQQSVTPTTDTLIPCAPEGAAEFTRTCTIERSGDTFTVRNPDGGFHRLMMTSDGGVAAADGAEPAQVTMRGRETIEVTIGGDRYRMPATP